MIRVEFTDRELVALLRLADAKWTTIDKKPLPLTHKDSSDYNTLGGVIGAMRTAMANKKD